MSPHCDTEINSKTDSIEKCVADLANILSVFMVFHSYDKELYLRAIAKRAEKLAAAKRIEGKE